MCRVAYLMHRQGSLAATLTDLARLAKPRGKRRDKSCRQMPERSRNSRPEVNEKKVTEKFVPA